MIKLVKKGKNLFIFPEGTWNYKPSAPLLPLYWGCVEIAYNTKCPIIPIALDYSDNTCYVKFGEPLYIETENKSFEILRVEEALSTLLWDIWESPFCFIHLYIVNWIQSAEPRVLSEKKKSEENIYFGNE